MHDLSVNENASATGTSSAIRTAFVLFVDLYPVLVPKNHILSPIPLLPENLLLSSMEKATACMVDPPSTPTTHYRAILALHILL